MGRERRGARGSAREQGASLGCAEQRVERKESCERSHFFLPRTSSGRRALEEAGGARAREGASSQTARAQGDSKTRSAGARETPEEPAGIVGGESFVSFGEPFRALGPAPHPELPAGSPPAPSRAPRSWLRLQICPFVGFSTLVEGIGPGRRNFFPFKKTFFGRC